MEFEGDNVHSFREKPQVQAGEGWINGGFFVFELGVLDYISGDDAILERDPFENLAIDGQLMAYRHTGFWQMMGTIQEKRILEAHWESGNAPWKVW